MNTHVQPPAEPQDASLYYPTPVTPEEAFQALGRLRKEARDEIDRLIRFLDTTDDYVSRELEDQVDDGPVDTDELEPGFCGVTVNAGSMPQESWIDEAEGDGDGGDANDKPSLGSVAAVGMRGGQEHWSQGLAGDEEGDAFEDDEDGADGEPEESDDDIINEASLGWPERDSQRIWDAVGDHSDLQVGE